MQTFITDHSMIINFKNLDNKRLGKQRVESCQILKCLLVEESRWKNHPAVKMWKDYEAYLVHIYLRANIEEWSFRGFKGPKCQEHYEQFTTLVSEDNIVKPPWITDKFILVHKSNLIRKDADYYKPIFGDIDPTLEYIWPSKL